MPRRFPRDRATEHLLDVATRAGIDVEWIRGFRGAESYPKLVFLPRPTSGLHYMVALHELGHCLSPEAVALRERTDVYGESLCEGAAWAWAAENRYRDIPVTRAEWHRAAELLASYWAPGRPHEARSPGDA